ncbi:hypothetical protein BC936DRAFT_138541 [Jimgerdemannia flammicorona]|uniref:Uncharacterized protein n=1 Tax=Jimgerdemannia flammicorona TaxID=994334 RepID=A0A433DI86_9FUNG|nr:hypothetical protein BC936DRAFT_138541 [Jimgerdemannia flammicorona]
MSDEPQKSGVNNNSRVKKIWGGFKSRFNVKKASREQEASNDISKPEDIEDPVEDETERPGESSQPPNDGTANSKTKKRTSVTGLFSNMSMKRKKTDSKKADPEPEAEAEAEAT